MTMRTVDWTALRPHDEVPPVEGLRERKKRLLRRQLSDTATEMFMERGFDAVRVAEIAEACGVSEKTVFNYFPTKESLVLDLGEVTMASLRAVLADPDLSPVDAALKILSSELANITSWLSSQNDPAEAKAMLLRFGMLIRSTPSLRAHQRDTTDKQVAVAADVLAQRTGMSSDDPESQIAATALLALWSIQFRALRKHLNRTQTFEELHDAVSADVQRAARLIDIGLNSLAPRPEQSQNQASGLGTP
ncbi:TetR family transcriptional regulator [Streptomyces sp. NPDC001351]|uniref:TetR family transcriptional regulator n=1 Tax=Streptomyces sp. NPDC001351 TaxID=3364564 RepID=UPI00368433C2